MAVASQKHTVDASAEDFAAKQKRFAHAIVTGDHESAEQVTGELLSAQQTLGDIYLKVISPALVNVGELWCRGDIGVGEQKLATQIVISQMDRLRAVFALHESRSPYRVMVSCVQGEFHFIGARMVADLCLSRGWNVDFLGPDVPTGALIDVIKGRHPQLLALSTTMEQGLIHAREVIGAAERAAPALRIVLGGRAIPMDAQAKNFGRHCEIAHDTVEGVATIGKLLRADRPSAVLKEYQLVLARRVRDLRMHKGWTQERLAEATRVTRVCIVAVEGGKQNVSMAILIRLANALGVAPETLLSVED
jgi:MerR family transcriptional regulator, light-induced transcriptional regulator